MLLKTHSTDDIKKASSFKKRVKYFLKEKTIEEENEHWEHSSNLKVKIPNAIPRSFNDISPLVTQDRLSNNFSIPLSNSDSPSNKSLRRKTTNALQTRYRASTSKLGSLINASKMTDSRKERMAQLSPPIDFEKMSSRHVLKIMALCHNIRSKRRSGIQSNKNIFHEKSYTDDDLLLTLPVNSSIHFVGSVIVNNELCFKINVDGKSERYKILGINDSIQVQKRLSVILNPEKEETSGSDYNNLEV